MSLESITAKFQCDSCGSFFEMTIRSWSTEPVAVFDYMSSALMDENSFMGEDTGDHYCRPCSDKIGEKWMRDHPDYICEIIEKIQHPNGVSMLVGTYDGSRYILRLSEDSKVLDTCMADYPNHTKIERDIE